MTASKSRIAFTDCYEMFEKALEDPKGIRIKFASTGDAFHYRLRLNQARRIDRLDNLQTFNEEHPMYGRSVYDKIICRVTQDNGNVYVSLEKIDSRVFEIESLGDA